MMNTYSLNAAAVNLLVPLVLVAGSRNQMMAGDPAYGATAEFAEFHDWAPALQKVTNRTRVL